MLKRVQFAFTCESSASTVAFYEHWNSLKYLKFLLIAREYWDIYVKTRKDLSIEKPIQWSTCLRDVFGCTIDL